MPRTITDPEERKVTASVRLRWINLASKGGMNLDQFIEYLVNKVKEGASA